jgi:D-3-phosphoglycerate dehydrogenase / 2-oxoglutarate reductase
LVVKILVCDSIHEDGVKILKDAGFQVDVETKITTEEIKEKINSYDAVVVRSRTSLTRDIINSTNNLKAIARAGVGLDNIDLEATKEKGIQVFNSPEAPSNAVAELVLGNMICMARMIHQANNSMKQGKWEKTNLTGIEVQGKTLGIIGFGNIGYNLGKKAKCLGMKVIVFARSNEKERTLKKIDEINAEAVDLDTLFKMSQFISLHIPLKSSTRYMIDSDEFQKMRDGVYIINTARGGIINEQALKNALENGKVKGAALDVFEQEPPQDMDLISRPNVICTPHIGAGSVEAQIGNSTVVAQKLVEFFKNNTFSLECKR